MPGRAVRRRASAQRARGGRSAVAAAARRPTTRSSSRSSAPGRLAEDSASGNSGNGDPNTNSILLLEGEERPNPNLPPQLNLGQMLELVRAEVAAEFQAHQQMNQPSQLLVPPSTVQLPSVQPQPAAVQPAAPLTAIPPAPRPPPQQWPPAPPPQQWLPAPPPQQATGLPPLPGTCI